MENESRLQKINGGEERRRSGRGLRMETSRRSGKFVFVSRKGIRSTEASVLGCLSPQDPSGKVVKEPSLCRRGGRGRREGKLGWKRVVGSHSGQDGLKGAVNVTTGERGVNSRGTQFEGSARKEIHTTLEILDLWGSFYRGWKKFFFFNLSFGSGVAKDLFLHNNFDWVSERENETGKLDEM